jgi:hypothetical protein
MYELWSIFIFGLSLIVFNLYKKQIHLSSLFFCLTKKYRDKL